MQKDAQQLLCLQLSTGRWMGWPLCHLPRDPFLGSPPCFWWYHFSEALTLLWLCKTEELFFTNPPTGPTSLGPFLKEFFSIQALNKGSEPSITVCLSKGVGGLISMQRQHLKQIPLGSCMLGFCGHSHLQFQRLAAALLCCYPALPATPGRAAPPKRAVPAKCSM